MWTREVKDREQVSDAGQRGLWQGVPYKWTHQGSYWRRLQCHLQILLQVRIWWRCVSSNLEACCKTVHWATNSQMRLRNMFKATAQQKKVSDHLKWGTFIMACFYLSFLFLWGSIAKGWVCMGPQWNAAVVQEHTGDSKMESVKNKSLRGERVLSKPKARRESPQVVNRERWDNFMGLETDSVISSPSEERRREDS